MFGLRQWWQLRRARQLKRFRDEIRRNETEAAVEDFNKRVTNYERVHGAKPALARVTYTLRDQLVNWAVEHKRFINTMRLDNQEEAIEWNGIAVVPRAEFEFVARTRAVTKTRRRK